MSTVQQLAETLAQVDGRFVIAHQHRCVHVRNRHTACRACADACTSGCISFENGELAIDAGRCCGCGTCCTACPTCALEAAAPNDAALYTRALAAQRAAGGLAVFASEQACARGAFDPAKVVPVVGLGRVDETLLVRLAAAGAGELVLVHAAEPSEAEAAGVRMARTVVAGANRILAAWGSPARARLVEAFPPAVAAAPGAADPQQQVASAPAAPSAAEPYRRMKVMHDQTLPHFMPDRRDLLLDALFDLGEPAEPTAALDVRLWGRVTIDPTRCQACRSCATFCPTGALHAFDEGGTCGIEHVPGDCVRCLCCQDVCQADAIRIDGSVSAAEVLSGDAERYDMPPVVHDDKRMFHAVKRALGIEKVYER